MGNMNKRGRSTSHLGSRNLNRFAQNTTPDLQSFREALVVLQRQVDDLDELKARHYQEIMEHEEEVWDFAQGKVSTA